ncbi:MAG: hemin uptake protein HemP [Rhodocyclaceae bacterium]|jgi:hemin uptake protein HemP|nr:hemin uptake protein HemP [Rhodocyclaceae bacterium]MCW5596261.1 hemin uptake protein HemP [Rhodocyclaceae bacterium]PKO72611.1 MAG: hemin uptake protein HemP [Betaproteobacteria bacterium HGW-Betaproteobacteria-14]
MVKLSPAPRRDEPMAATPAAPQPPVTSTELLRGRNEVLIAHRGEHYRLRQTSSGKLILTK